MHARFLIALLSSLLLMGQASAGLISVSAEVSNYIGPDIPVSGGYFTWASGQTYTPALVFWSWNLVSAPPTPVQLSVEVGDGPYVKQLYVNATISGQIIPNTFDWQFSAMPVQTTFPGAVVTVSFQAVALPTGILPFGASVPSGPTYYSAFDVEANVTVSSTACGTAMTPEPSSAVLLAGLTLGGLVARRFRRVLAI